jgi:hypothetical protein
MDRLSPVSYTLPVHVILAAAVFFAAGCTSESGRPSGKMERAQSVKPSATERGPESFCDRLNPSGSAPLLALPAMNNVASGRPERISSQGRWAWINIWATFCKPCLGEMDTLVTWRDQLSASGTPVDLLFVSVDEGVDVVKQYLAKNRKIASMPSYHASDSPALEAAIKPLGLGSLDMIPMHILVAPDGRVRCTRAGALNGDDLPVVRKIFQAIR